MLAIGRLQLSFFHMNEHHAGASCFCLGGGATCCDLDWKGFNDVKREVPIRLCQGGRTAHCIPQTLSHPLRHSL